MEIKGLKKPLYNYQKAGVNIIAAAQGRFILADKPGLGKTAQALAYVVSQGIKKALVICPATMKPVWEEETKKWTTLKPFVINSDFIALSMPEIMEVLSSHQLFVINYELLKKFHQFLASIAFEILVPDEAHFIKSTGAIRTKFTKLISSKIPKVLMLTGTPVLSRPIELFSLLNIIDPKEWDNWFKYSVRYAAGHRTRWGWDVSGASNISELREKIKPYFLQRTKEEVLTELPPKQFIDIPVQLEGTFLTQYTQAEKHFLQYLRNHRHETEARIRKIAAAEQLVKLNELRQLTTAGKVEAAKEIIDSLLESDEKVVVFSVYNKPLEDLAVHYGSSAVTLTGKTSQDERPGIIHRFQTDPNTKIFLGGTKAAGVGITLTAAPNVLFLDYSWNPADMEQSADRIHRIGQKAESINIYQLYAQGTIDDYMRKLLADKQAIISQLIEGRESVEEENYMQMIIKNLENKYIST